MAAYSGGMSNRPSAPHTDRPTATYPTGYLLPEGWRVDPRPGRYLDPADPRLVRSDATPTGAFPTRRSIRPLVSSQQAAARAARAARPEQGTDAATTARTRPGTRACHTSAAPSTEQAASAETTLPDFNILDAGRPASDVRRSRRPRVSTPAKPTGSRKQLADAHTGTKGLRRHLRAALAALALAAAILIPMQLFAAHGISSARQAALASSQRDASQATEQAEQAAPAPVVQPDARSDIQPDWVTEDTDSPYDRTDPAASPLDLPRCTTSPDTPLPCLATISPDSSRAVVLEEDASLTALVRR